ncbi:MAG: hypothetical protein ACTSRZ_05870 [Promethearchaeota archaeon]
MSFDSLEDDRFFEEQYGTPILTPEQIKLREEMFRIYYFRALPILGVGMLIWIFSTLSIDSILIAFTTTGYILSYIGYFVLWVLTYIFALKRMNTASALTFFAASYVNGIVQSPIIAYATSVLGSYSQARSLFLLAAILGIIAVSTGITIGSIFKHAIKEKLLIISIIGIVIVGITEMILYFTMASSFGTWILWTSAIYLMLFIVVVIYDGAILKEIVLQSYMLGVLNLFLDFVIITIRIFIILVSLLASDN